LFLFLNGGRSVTFTIKIYTTTSDGLETLVHETTISAISPLGARKEAHRLLAAWKKRGANSATHLNVWSQLIPEPK
jgi:hypothetical protein